MASTAHALHILVKHKEIAEDIISISKSYNVNAQIIGKVAASGTKKLTIESEFGVFEY